MFFFYLIFIEIHVANSGDPDQMPRSAASDHGLHCLSGSQKWDTRLIWVKSPQDRTYIVYAISGCPGISGFKDVYWNIYCYCGDFRRDFVRGKCLRSQESDHKMN